MLLVNWWRYLRRFAEILTLINLCLLSQNGIFRIAEVIFISLLGMWQKIYIFINNSNFSTSCNHFCKSIFLFLVKTHCCCVAFPFPTRFSISVFDGALQWWGMETRCYLWCTFPQTTWRKMHRFSRLLWRSKSGFAV